MKMSYWALILTFIACVAGGLVWSANHYHGKFLEEQKRADAAEQRADSTEAIWGDTVVECVLNKLCPSHTYVIFKYPE
ncbi:hypothetical protein JS721_001117 [Escherichia coli]|nr:hypothetical protein [Escherichia coli]